MQDTQRTLADAEVSDAMCVLQTFAASTFGAELRQ
jgi:hypothetical protein